MMELGKRDTKMIQGLSVLAMVWLHLFDTWNYEGIFQPFIFFKGIPLVFYIAQLCDFCVMGFAFCSGYAHYKLFKEKDYYKKRLHSLLRLLLRYWIVIVFFSAVSIFIGTAAYMPGSGLRFVLNLFLIDSYNGAWWYMFAYTIIVLVSPALLKCVYRYPAWIAALFSGVLYCGSYYFRFNNSSPNLLLSKISPLGMTVVEYLMGAYAAKIGYFTIGRRLWNELNRLAQFVVSISLIILMLIFRTLIVPSLFVSPATGIVLITLFCFWKKPVFVESFLQLIGNHSTHIWLTHMFFYLYLFKGLVYKAIYPIAVYTFMIAITLVISVLLGYIEKMVFSLFGI